jgi:hypothetical protein
MTVMKMSCEVQYALRNPLHLLLPDTVTAPRAIRVKLSLSKPGMSVG